MKVVVCGGDGYCGWPTALRLSSAGYEVVIVDNLIRREWDVELNTASLTPIASIDDRVEAWREATGRVIEVAVGDLLDYELLADVFARHSPAAAVHFAEQR